MKCWTVTLSVAEREFINDVANRDINCRVRDRLMDADNDKWFSNKPEEYELNQQSYFDVMKVLGNK